MHTGQPARKGERSRPAHERLEGDVTDADDGIAIGMDVECMRIVSLIDEMASTRGTGSYARGQLFILRELKRRIYDEATIYTQDQR